MGLIKALVSSIVGTAQDTWKDYFVCESMDSDTLMVKGVKKGAGFGDSNVITNGSGIVVAEGQCALIVNEGNILEVAAEPGNYTFDSAASPSVFDGGFEGIKNTFKDMLARFTFEGVANKDQRVYYVNTKEIFGNMFGTPSPIPFRIIDKNVNLDVEMPIRCNGEYTFKIVNPLVFYKNVAGNDPNRFEKDELVKQMKSEMLNSLQKALAKIAAEGVRYYEVAAHVDELANAFREELAEKWAANRGIEFCNISINSLTMDPENEAKLRDLQMSAVNKDVNMAAATMTQAYADAVRDAANNPNGAMNGFMGVNMAQGAANNATALFQQAAAQQAATNDGNADAPAMLYCPFCGQQIPADSAFCPKCGKALR